MIYTSIDKRYPYMAMLCELIDKYFVETLLCSGGGKMGIRGIRWRERFIMRWKVVTAMLLLALNNITYAQIADVSGVGEDRDSALRDAERNAVEQIVGTYINSETLVSQASVVSDEIYAKSVGFITDVRVIDEGKRNGSYYVRAKIDVNTNPNSELMNRIEMIKALGDPRIGVVVTYYSDADNAAKEKYPLMCESAINRKLVELGFSHVIDSALIYNEKNFDRGMALDASALLPNPEMDYLIIGKLDLHTGNISLPRYTDLGSGDLVENFSTNLINSVAEINVEVVKAATGEVVNTFRSETKAINNSNNSSENTAVVQLSEIVATKIKSVLANKASAADNQVQVEIETDNYKFVSEIITALKHTAGVSNVQEKNFSNGKATVTIETTLKPQTVFRLLKEKCKCNLFIKNITANNIVITAE